MDAADTKINVSRHSKQKKRDRQEHIKLITILASGGYEDA